MSIPIARVVTNGVIVLRSPLPEGATVEVIVVDTEKSTAQFGSVLETQEPGTETARSARGTGSRQGGGHWFDTQ